MKGKSIDVVVAGHICLDIIPTIPDTSAKKIEELFAPGQVITVGEMVLATGGAVSNTGNALIKLGLKVRSMGKISDDLFGTATLEILRRVGAHQGMKIVKGAVSSYTIVISPPGIDRFFLHYPGPNATFDSRDIDINLVKKARLFHFGYPPLLQKMVENNGRELVRMFKKVKDTGAVTSLDMCLPDPNNFSGKANWEEILKKLLPYIDIFLPSFEEIGYMLDREEFLKMKEKASGSDVVQLISGDWLDKLADKVISFGVKIVGIKCGVRGFFLKTAKLERIWEGAPKDANLWASRQLWEPCFQPKKFVSATGAGDCAIAGFLMAYLKGASPELTLKYSAMTAAHCVEKMDAFSGVRTFRELTKCLNEKWSKMDLPVNTPGWSYDKHEEVWRGPNDGKS